MSVDVFVWFMYIYWTASSKVELEIGNWVHGQNQVTKSKTILCRNRTNPHNLLFVRHLQFALHHFCRNLCNAFPKRGKRKRKRTTERKNLCRFLNGVNAENQNPQNQQHKKRENESSQKTSRIV